MRQILAESDQIRRDADNLGPRAELEFWRKRMVRFGYLIDQLGSQQVKVSLPYEGTCSQQVKAAVGVLQIAQSKRVKVNIVHTTCLTFSIRNYFTCLPLYNCIPPPFARS